MAKLKWPDGLRYEGKRSFIEFAKTYWPHLAVLGGVFAALLSIVAIELKFN